MPILKNPKHEAFAQALAKGKTQIEAYAEAGYKPNESHASRLVSNGKVSVRVAELTEKTAERAQIDITRTLQELVRLGTADLRQAFTPDGRLKPPSEWSDDFAATVAQIEVVTRPAGKDADGNTEIEYVHKIKTWDKNSALEKIAKHLGMFIERKEVTIKHVIEEMPDDELERELMRAVSGEPVEGQAVH